MSLLAVRFRAVEFGFAKRPFCCSVWLLSPLVLPAMAPKLHSRKDEEKVVAPGLKRFARNSSKKQTRQETCTQILAQEEAYHYKENVTLSIYLEVERVVEGL